MNRNRILVTVGCVCASVLIAGTPSAKAANKAKKAVEGYLSPLDEINKFNKANEDGADSGGGAGGGAAGLCLRKFRYRINSRILPSGLKICGRMLIFMS